MQKRKNLISKKTGIGDHMTADLVTDIIFNKAERYLDVIKKGILETYIDMTESEVLLYLKEKIK